MKGLEWWMRTNKQCNGRVKILHKCYREGRRRECLWLFIIAGLAPSILQHVVAYYNYSHSPQCRHTLFFDIRFTLSSLLWCSITLNLQSPEKIQKIDMTQDPQRMASMKDLQWEISTLRKFAPIRDTKRIIVMDFSRVSFSDRWMRIDGTATSNYKQQKWRTPDRATV